MCNVRHFVNGKEVAESELKNFEIVDKAIIFTIKEALRREERRAITGSNDHDSSYIQNEPEF